MADMPSQDKQNAFSASAPGNMILMGEYAVLEGARAVLMTLSCRLTVTITPADELSVTSDIFGIYPAPGSLSLLDKIKNRFRKKPDTKPQHVHLCRNVLTAFFSQQGIAPAIFAVDITSTIPPTYGFGSSAALAAALVRALYRAYGIEEEFTGMFTIGHRAILDTFRRGSGADLAAALADMPFLVFSPLSKTVAPFAMPFSVQAVYTGYKTPTPEVLRRVKQNVPQAEWKSTVSQMGDCVNAFITGPSAEGVRAYQKLMDRLGVTCPKCRMALDAFEKAGIPAKISGSGMGDCIVGFSSGPASVSVEPPLQFLSAKEMAA